MTQLLALPRGSLPNIHLAFLFPTWCKPARALLLSCWRPLVALAVCFSDKVSQPLQAIILVPPGHWLVCHHFWAHSWSFLDLGLHWLTRLPPSTKRCLSTILKSSLNIGRYCHREQSPDLFLCLRHSLSLHLPGGVVTVSPDTADDLWPVPLFQTSSHYFPQAPLSCWPVLSVYFPV